MVQCGSRDALLTASRAVGRKHFVFLDQATVCCLRARTYLDGHAACGRPGRE